MRRAQQLWTQEEVARLKREAIVRPTDELAAELGRSVHAVKQHCLKLGIPCRPMPAGRPPVKKVA